MARVQIFQGGNIGPDAPNVTPFRAPDFGPGIGSGVERLGQSIGEAAQAVDQIQDVHARIEANRLSIAHAKLQQTIDQRVRSTLGEGAEAAADMGIEDLNKGTDDLLATASPRARAILGPQFAERNLTTRGEWWNHGFEQKKQAFDTSSQAANDTDLESALHSDNDQTAKGYLDAIAQRNHARASFFGLGSAWETTENLKAVSSYHKGRAQQIGESDATAAIQYALDNRGSMSDDDFNAIVRSYHGAAIDDQATLIATGMEPGSTAEPVEGETPTRTADPKAVFAGLIVPNEGSALVQHDSNGAPVKYGINGKANPDVDVAKLDYAGARKLFIDRTWIPSGADKLAPALAVVHADTFYLNQKKAMEFLRESGGDVDKYMELRNSFLASLHASNPDKYPDYTKRNERVAQYASAVGTGGAQFSFSGKVTPSTSITDVTKEVMERKDIPMDLKVAVINKVREQRATLREDQTIKQDDARDTLISAATKLGDNFTSIKQLDPEALATAKPETVKTLTDWAKEDKYKKDDEALRPLITETQITNPQEFLSKSFIETLMKRGASPSLIGEVQNQQAEIAKKAMNQKPDVVSSGELWTIAKPAFEASGIDVEAPLGVKASPKTRQAEAIRKQQALTYLSQMASDWAYTHPGEKATEQVMRQWIGAALLKTQSGKRNYEAADTDIVNSLPGPVRDSIVRDLRRHGNNSTGAELASDIASYYRKMRSIYGTGTIVLNSAGGASGNQLRGIAQDPEAQ